MLELRQRTGSETNEELSFGCGCERGRPPGWNWWVQIAVPGRHQELGGFFLASRSFLISSSFLARFGIFKEEKKKHYNLAIDRKTRKTCQYLSQLFFKGQRALPRLWLPLETYSVVFPWLVSIYISYQC